MAPCFSSAAPEAWTADLGPERLALLGQLQRIMQLTADGSRVSFRFRTRARARIGWEHKTDVRPQRHGTARSIDLRGAFNDALNAHPFPDGLSDGDSIWLLRRGEAALVRVLTHRTPLLCFPIGPPGYRWQSYGSIFAKDAAHPQGPASLAALCCERLSPGQTVVLVGDEAASAHQRLERAMLLDGEEERFRRVLSQAALADQYCPLRAERTSSGCVLLGRSGTELAFACG